MITSTALYLAAMMLLGRVLRHCRETQTEPHDGEPHP